VFRLSESIFHPKLPTSKNIASFYGFKTSSICLHLNVIWGVWGMVWSREEWSIRTRICTKGNFFSNSLGPNDPRLNSDLRGDRSDTNRQSTWSINISTNTHEQETELEFVIAVDVSCIGIEGPLTVGIRIP